jgi:periplasmic protein TonB
MTSITANNSIPLHHRKFGQKDPARRMIGWGVVIVIHAIVLWALVTGTAMKALKIIKKPLEAAVIQEVIIPPPPPPPPPKEIVKPQAPKAEAPPPPFVPPPEVVSSPAPAIVSVQTPPTTPTPIAPPVAPAAPPARQDIAVACPTQVKPDMPKQASRDGIGGVVKAQATIRDGRVVGVEFLSGPRVFYSVVREAMVQYRCVSAQSDVVATQEFVFKVE